MEIRVKDIIKSEIALSPDSGHLLYRQIRDSIKSTDITLVDFSNVKVISTAFLNSAIGRLYNDFSSEQLNKFLKVQNLDNEDLTLMKKVIRRAKEYFSDKNDFEKKMGDRYGE